MHFLMAKIIQDGTRRDEEHKRREKERKDREEERQDDFERLAAEARRQESSMEMIMMMI